MTGRRRGALWAGVVVVALLVAWYAGTQSAPGAPGPATGSGSVRLGPDPGEPVAHYLARLPAELPPPGSTAPALVQLTAELTPAGVAALVGPLAVDSVVLRVALPRVQTALRFESLAAGVPLATALATAHEQTRRRAAADAARLTGRPGAVAAAESAALVDPSCACVLAFVVEGDRAALVGLATRPGVRAVHAAPPDTSPVELALSPLLPGQVEVAAPLPDDGPVPTR